MRDVVHKYFKKTFGKVIILVQVNPVTFRGMELSVSKEATKKRKLTFDEEIENDLAVDGFQPSSALEFNLYLNGLRGE